MKDITGLVYDVQGFSVQDGPGIRTTVFLKGCPLHCPWCHSPESQKFHPQLSWMEMRCLGLEKCGKCISQCPNSAITEYHQREDYATGEMLTMIHINRSLCDDCGKCADICYAKALYICGEEYTPEKMLKKVLKDKKFYEKSGGGVTISGGEPLSQIDFTEKLLQLLKKHEIHTALDTTGYTKTENIEKVLPYTDLFLYDLKHMDSELHEKMVGVPNEIILSNAKYIADHGGKFQIRVPVIPRFNDDEANLKNVAEFCLSLGKAIQVIQLLPLHNMGLSKYQRLDQDRIVFEVAPPSDEKMKKIQKMFSDYGLEAIIH